MIQQRRRSATVLLGRPSQIAEEVLAHLIGLAGAEVTVTENGRTLKFEQGSGFERD